MSRVYTLPGSASSLWRVLAAPSGTIDYISILSARLCQLSLASSGSPFWQAIKQTKKLRNNVHTHLSTESRLRGKCVSSELRFTHGRSFAMYTQRNARSKLDNSLQLDNVILHSLHCILLSVHRCAQRVNLLDQFLFGLPELVPSYCWGVWRRRGRRWCNRSHDLAWRTWHSWIHTKAPNLISLSQLLCCLR